MNFVATLQELRDQRLAEEAAQQRERREREAMKRKEKQDFSANASSEVKQKLQVCVDRDVLGSVEV